MYKLLKGMDLNFDKIQLITTAEGKKMYASIKFEQKERMTIRQFGVRLRLNRLFLVQPPQLRFQWKTIKLCSRIILERSLGTKFELV
ncbi:hypothetical protein CEXT_462081 [Caerostris extrusa]|uniref:Uncharacterized protein n=1 Tax=Caerostris extrusa TaxID=172846 RepID=A0AAV4P6B6_CAEEX|nr:hypothetical protein CEXT_462081 [Caerostris extrusa]